MKDPKTGKERVDAKGKPIMTGPISESAFLAQQVARHEDSGARSRSRYKAFFEDVFWSLLNTNEFILNH